MFRFVRVYVESSGDTKVIYYVKNARIISAYRRIQQDYSSAFTLSTAKIPIVFDTSLIFEVPASARKTGRYFELIAFVPENQPAEESVEELTSNGAMIVVYNENGGIVCHNGLISENTAISNWALNGNPEGITSEPTDGPGEMTSEPIDGPGEML